MSMKRIKWVGAWLGIILVISISNSWAQTDEATCDKSCMGTIKDLIQMRQPGGFGTSFLEKSNFRLGDKVADGIIKSFPGTKILMRANIKIYLPIIREAFSGIEMIETERNRKPVATIRMLNRVGKLVTDEPSRREVSDLIDWLNHLEI